ncbi:MAG TPA: UDP-N-acetylmuramoyl-tripeptide--D-alanyl-D-alanine ligase [Gammaproteobacteria bacterium]|jgi:UDP-N-acetylmuramoyl-tripeptide--D-alanyl-D-alanine ligase|nr:UDP-N-acetylmuramoyl-tripeptide--D-alanyl-D-alanine ligase [Gammaproteobacteria bacterium]
MIQMTLTQAANLLGLPAGYPDIRFQGICIDSRKLEPGNLFIAIPGERVDGHDFIEMAQQKGAVAALTTRPVSTTLPTLQVEDITLALGKLSSAWRNQFSLPFIAVTGSNGKTTTKNMIASILEAACEGNKEAVLATQGTLNNHLGLPLTLARLTPVHRYAAIEMGMNHFGEIEYLTKITKPCVAVITNAAASHLAGVGNVQGVARAKAEIFSGLSEKGIAILNRDDDFYTFWRKTIGEQPFLTFGLHRHADIHLETEYAPGMPTEIRTPHGNITIQLPLLGKHNVQNALAAIAATLAINIDLTAIKKGLENIKPAPGRLEMHTLKNGTYVIDDSYNANPFSLNAAVNTLSAFQGKKILVLGDMKELGAEEVQLHQHAGEAIRQAGIDHLFTYGKLSASTTQAFGEGACHFTEQEALLCALKPLLNTQSTILVKGSRSMKMEKIVTDLIN